MPESSKFQKNSPFLKLGLRFLLYLYSEKSEERFTVNGILIDFCGRTDQRLRDLIYNQLLPMGILINEGKISWQEYSVDREKLARFIVSDVLENVTWFINEEFGEELIKAGLLQKYDEPPKLAELSKKIS